MASTKLQQELKKKRPFESPEQEAALNLELKELSHLLEKVREACGAEE